MQKLFNMNKKEKLKRYYSIYKEINDIQENLIPTKYLDWILSLDDLWNKFWDLYKMDFNWEEDDELLFMIYEIEDRWMKTFNTSLLKEEDLNTLKHKVQHQWKEEECIRYNINDVEKFSYAVVYFKDINEIIDYLWIEE